MDKKNSTPIFVMPLRIGANEELELRHFKLAVESIKQQTDENWKLVIIVERDCNPEIVFEILDELKEQMQEKLHIIYSDKSNGIGSARNRAIVYAHETGAPFILYNDSDDLSDKRRLELVRNAFEDEMVNVVYTSFEVIDENGDIVAKDKIPLPIKEIIDGNQIDVVEGENAWINIALKKKYTNLTSCTAVRTNLAYEEQFPIASVSEDCHTWFRYGAHRGKFVFLRQIKGRYRICTGTASRTRSQNVDFYEKMMKMDSSGFEEALKIAKKLGTMGGYDEDYLRAGFYVRLALNLLHSGSRDYCKESLKVSLDISKEKTLQFIDALQCESNEKKQLKQMID